MLVFCVFATGQSQLRYQLAFAYIPLTATDGNGAQIQNGGQTNSDSIMVTFPGPTDVSTSSYSCTLYPEGYVNACSTPINLPGLAIGQHTLTVTNTANQDVATFTWTIGPSGGGGTPISTGQNSNQQCPAGGWLTKTSHFYFKVKHDQVYQVCLAGNNCGEDKALIILPAESENSMPALCRDYPPLLGEQYKVGSTDTVFIPSS